MVSHKEGENQTKSKGFVPVSANNTQRQEDKKVLVCCIGLPFPHILRLRVHQLFLLLALGINSKMAPRFVSTVARLTPRLMNRTSKSRYFHVSSLTSNASVPSTNPRVEETFQKILQLDTIEVHLLTELVNEKLGVTTVSANQAMMSGGSGASESADNSTEEAETKTAFDVKLTAFDAKAKIKVIKEIRAITGLGLKDAKEMVEGVPKVVKKDIKMEEAEEIKAKVEAVGGTVEIS